MTGYFLEVWEGRQTAVGPSAPGAWTYTYDSFGQLKTAIGSSSNVSVPGSNFSYSFDGAGNRTDGFSANLMNEYASFTYDLRGNMIADGQFVYSRGEPPINSLRRCRL